MSEPKATVKVGLKKIFESQKILQKVLNTPVDIKTAYRMTKLADILLREFKSIEKLRISLVEKYGDKNDKGDYSVSPEKIKDFSDEFESLLDVEIDLDVQLIPFSCLKNIPIAAADLVVIQPFLADPEPEDLK